MRYNAGVFKDVWFVGAVGILLPAVTAIINASGAAAYIGDFDPASKILLFKNLFQIMPKLAKCALDIRTAKARNTKAEKL